MNRRKNWIGSLGFALPLVLALLCILFVTLGTHQARESVPMGQTLLGEYSYDGVTWHPLQPESTLSALEEDLYLRGSFSAPVEEGVQLCFYRNHIGVAMRRNGEFLFMDDVMSLSELDAPAHVKTDLFASMCAREWMSLLSPGITAEDRIEIHLHNPHRAGNGSAYEDFLSTLCIKPQVADNLEKNIGRFGVPQRIAGGLLAAVSLMLLGAAAAARVVHSPMVPVLLKLGLMTLFVGGYVVLDTADISFWNELNVMNTYGQQLSMMLAVFCLESLIGGELTGKRQTAAKLAVLLSAGYNSVLIVLSFTDVCVIYDTLPWWSGAQWLLCPLFLVLCGLELWREPKKRLMPLSAMVLFAAILLDLAGVGSSLVWRSPCAKVAFAALFAIHITVGARVILQNHRASLRADRLEKELEDSRIAIMLSQIKPHFLYNVLNAIYHLYRKEPETAQEAVSSFAEYLRCNMLSIEKREPIPFTEEYQHIQTYLSLELIRHRGKLDVIYDVEVSDFRLPPLTVEPLVENAVKHGVTKKRGGGTVTISTRRTGKGYTITVADTGIGFDPNHYMEDGKPHVGIANVRQRLQSMVGGSLSITSSAEGTVAVVTIPAKEEKRYDENHRSR